MEIKKAYQEILKVCNKYNIEELAKIQYEMENKMYFIELEEKYGLKISNYISNNSSKNFVRINEYLTIAIWGEEHNRTICNIDTQPIDEILLQISFPTGAYIFGDDYPKEIFKDFFEELKSYNYKYIDKINDNLYFTLENSKDIFNNFNEIFKKYLEMYRNNYKQRQIEKLEKELESLKEENK